MLADIPYGWSRARERTIAESESSKIQKALSERGSHLQGLGGRGRGCDLEFRRITLAPVRKIDYSFIRWKKRDKFRQ